MSKWPKILVFMLSMALLLSACGKSAEQTKAPAASDTPKVEAPKPVTITYGHWNQQQEPAIQEIIAKFREKFPHITVQTQVTPNAGYWEKMQTFVAGGEAYDVFWMNGPNFPFYASKGVLLDLTDAAKAAGLTDKYPKSLVDMYTWNNKTYGLPRDYDTIGLFYNKKAFAEAGVPLPPSDWSWKWDDFVAAARKLTKDSTGKQPGQAGFNPANINRYGFALTAGQVGHFNLIFSNGGTLISADKKKSGYDDPATIDAMEKLATLMHTEGVVATGAALPRSATEPEKLFLAGKAAMMFHGSWKLKPYLENKDIEIGVTYLPVIKQKATVIHGLANAVYAKTKYPKEATEFVKFLGSKEAADILAKTGTVIPAYNGTQEAWVKSFTQADASLFIKMAGNSFPLPATVANVELAPVELEAMERLYGTKANVKDLLTNLAKQMNQVLATK